MMLVIDTQYMENYGAHDWDGIGKCPEFWKMKGGYQYKILGAPSDADPYEIAKLCNIEYDDIGSKEYVIGYHWESDDWLSVFEREQLEYEGKILHPEPTLYYTNIVESV